MSRTASTASSKRRSEATEAQVDHFNHESEIMHLDEAVRDKAIAKALSDLIGETEIIIEYFEQPQRVRGQEMVDFTRTHGHLHIKEVLVPAMAAIWDAAGGNAERLLATFKADDYYNADPQPEDQ